MSRMKRIETEFTQMRVQVPDHQYLLSQKHGFAEQLDAVLHRILESYRFSEAGDAEFMYQEQVKITQNWMKKCDELQHRLRARNQVLDQVLLEEEIKQEDESDKTPDDEFDKDEMELNEAQINKRQEG